MKKYIIFLLSLILLSSCLSQKQRDRICNECPVRTDSVVITSERLVLRDTTIYVTDRVVSYRDTIMCDSSGIIKPFLKIVKSRGIKATIQVKNNNITVDCETDSLKAIISNLVKEKETIINSNKTKTIEIPCENERTRFDGFTYWWFIITFVIILVYVGLRLVKTYFRLQNF